MRAADMAGAALAAVLLAGCSVGPHYAGPPAVAGDAVARGRFVRAGDAVFNPTPGLAHWWRKYLKASALIRSLRKQDSSPILKGPD